ncbi:MAG TPA: zf-HC2 domain-containing protein [Bryobacteraceae bacterium]|nr:zf-HC2 domain-containing protein [Bryobacteraceae bacterium]
MHIDEGILRARLDGELPAVETEAVERHLAACGRCRERSDALGRQAANVNAVFAGLGDVPQPDPAVALSRVRARQSLAPAERPWFGIFRGGLKPVWGAVAGIAIVATLGASEPGRAAAQRFLSLFRVKSVVVVPIERPNFDQGKGQLISQFLASSVNVTKEEKSQPAANREHAAELAGFALRLPAALTERPEITVEGEHAFQFTVDLERAQTLINVLGREDLKLPASLEGTRVAVDVPRGVTAKYGDCRRRLHGPGEPPTGGECIVVMQVPSPTVVTMPEIDLASIAEIGLQFTGMSPEDAKAFSRTVDWSTTLAIPLPPAVASHQEVTIEGVRGVLVTAKPRANEPTRYALVWVKNGIIHNVGGFGNPSMALPVAQSLQ